MPTPLGLAAKPMISGAPSNYIRHNEELGARDTYSSISLAAADVTLTLASSTILDALINLTGALGAARFLAYPAGYTFSRRTVKNSTTGGQTVTVKVVGGTGVVVPAGEAIDVWSDGTNCYAVTAVLPGTLDADTLDGHAASYFATDADLDSHLADTGNPHSVTKAQVGLGNVANLAPADLPISDDTQAALDDKADLVGGLVPAAQLPAYVDAVDEYANFAALPGTGIANRIYITLDDGKTFRWSGSAYAEISASLALGETSGTAYRGDRGKTAYDHSQLTSGNPHSVSKSDVGLGSADNTSDATKNSAAATLTNKRITQRVQSVADAATITPDADANDMVDITAIAQAFTIANATGTPTNGQRLIIQIKDNGTARAISFGSAYVAGGVALPTTTVLSKILTLGFIYTTANSLNKFRLIASAQEA